MKPLKRERVAPIVVARPADGITGTDADFSYAREEDWEDAIFRNADHFTVFRTRTDKQYFNDFAEACINAYHHPRALVYAVARSGRAFCVVRKRWAHYLEIWKVMTGV